MKKEERFARILAHFKAQMPHVTTELEFGSVFQLLVAVILSAQCTDKRINQVTPALFAHFPDAKTMAQAEPEDVLEYIRSVSYPNAKAEHLVKMARALVERHEGEVPSDMKVGAGCRYPRVSRGPQAGTRVATRQYALQGGAGTGEVYPQRGHPRCPPLAVAARQIRVHIAEAPLREMRNRIPLPETDRGIEVILIVLVFTSSYAAPNGGWPCGGSGSRP